MDALMAALVAAALAQLGDRTAWLAAILADRYRPAPVIAGAALALGLNYAVAGVGGALVAPVLTPDAKLLLLAVALVGAASTMAVAPKPPKDRLAGWRTGALGTATLGLFVMAFGDSAQFVAAALAARSPVPWLAGVGATIGALAVVAPAAVLGEAEWRRLPLAGVRRGGAALMLAAAIWLGLSALRLV